MKNMLKCVCAVALMLVAVSGCKDVGFNGGGGGSQEGLCSRSNTYAVVVGMENSAFAGACPGAEKDARRMYDLFAGYAANRKLFISGQANYADVRNALTEAADRADLFIFYYSGHGGSQRFADTGSDEDDGMDEFLCLNDRYMRDNDVWSVISRCRGRVVMVVDACHSKTMWRQPFTMRRIRTLRTTTHENGTLSFTCWSGCPDNTYSYGSSSGGEMTNAILRHFDNHLSYDELWEKVESDRTLKEYESVQRTKMGADFGDRPVFE